MKYILENNYPGGMTRDDIDANTTLLVLAGSETSATTLTGATYFCLNNPPLMQRLQEEIRSGFADQKSIDVDAVSKLPYLHAVFQETLRMHPTGPISVPRQIDRSGVTICGIPVPQGVSDVVPNMKKKKARSDLIQYRAGIPQKTAFHSPTNFVEPEIFNPDRWLKDADPKFDHENKDIFEPFMVGPRNCIGKS